MSQNIFLWAYFKITYYLYQLKNILICRTTLIYSWKPKGMSGESIENLTTSDNTFSSTLINYYPLPVVIFNRHCLINNNIFASGGSDKSIYFLDTRPMIKRFKYRFDFIQLLIWICKAN